jgi:hypothetical protein
LQVTTTFAISPGTGVLFAMQDMPWDHGPKVSADGNGLVGHAGAVAWLANTGESLAIMLRPGNAGSNTVSDHVDVLSDARIQVPARFRPRMIVRVGGGEPPRT